MLRCREGLRELAAGFAAVSQCAALAFLTLWLPATPAAAVPPAQPLLLSPGSGSVVDGTTVRFEWITDPSADNYCILLATDAGFSQVLLDVCLGVVGSVNVGGFSDRGSAIYWTIEARRGTESSFSAPGLFVNGPSALPDTPVLISPLNGAVNPGTNVEFEWSAAARAADYVLQVAADAAFTDLLIDARVGPVTGVTGVGFPEDGAPLFWRVMAVNARGESPFSPANVFTIEPVTALPGAATQLLPTDGSNAPGTSIRFEWDAAPLASGYRFELAADPTFGPDSLLLTQILGTNRVFPVSGFADDGFTYYWRLTATNSIGEGPGVVQSFVNGPGLALAGANARRRIGGVQSDGEEILILAEPALGFADAVLRAEPR